MKLVRSGTIVLLGSITDFGAQLLRNSIFARLLTVSDFGVVATFSILMTLIDTAVSNGLSRMIVQARDADDPTLQASLHTVQVLLAIFASLLLMVIAWPYSIVMGTPQQGWAYASLALIPVLRGLAHLDSLRLQRHGQFAPSVIRQTLPPIVALIAIWPAYIWLKDYRLVLVTIYAQQIALLVASHIGAQRPYRLGFNRSHMKRAFAFGWPLMANALLIYFVVNGDRIVVSNQFGIETLGWFSAAVMLTLMPINFVANALQTLALPAMAKQQDDSIGLQRQFDLVASLFALIGVGFVSGTALLGREVLTLMFGVKFVPATPYLLLLSIMQAIRMLRVACSIASMARGETKNPLYTNVVRGVFIPMSLLVALSTHDIFLMIAVGIVGEIVATLTGAWLAHRKVDLARQQFHFIFISTVIACVTIAAVALNGWPIVLLLPTGLLFLYAIRNLLLQARSLIRK